MRVKSIALWVLAVILAAALFYFFRNEMTPQNTGQVSMVGFSIGLSAVW